MLIYDSIFYLLSISPIFVHLYHDAMLFVTHLHHNHLKFKNSQIEYEFMFMNTVKYLKYAVKLS